MKPGDKVVFTYVGYLMAVKLYVSRAIAQAGEVLYGAGMAEITMLGKVTAMIVDDNDEFRPSI